MCHITIFRLCVLDVCIPSCEIYCENTYLFLSRSRSPFPCYTCGVFFLEQVVSSSLDYILWFHVRSYWWTSIHDSVYVRLCWIIILIILDESWNMCILLLDYGYCTIVWILMNSSRRWRKLTMLWISAYWLWNSWFSLCSINPGGFLILAMSHILFDMWNVCVSDVSYKRTRISE